MRIKTCVEGLRPALSLVHSVYCANIHVRFFPAACNVSNIYYNISATIICAWTLYSHYECVRVYNFYMLSLFLFDLQYVTFAQLFKGYTTTSFLNAIRCLCPPFGKNTLQEQLFETHAQYSTSMLKVIVGSPLFCSPVPYIERDRETGFKFNATPL